MYWVFACYQSSFSKSETDDGAPKIKYSLHPISPPYISGAVARRSAYDKVWTKLKSRYCPRYMGRATYCSNTYESGRSQTLETADNSALLLQLLLYYEYQTWDVLTLTGFVTLHTHTPYILFLRTRLEE